MNTTNEHPAVHSHSPHMMYWGSVKEKAEECVKHVLEGGSHPTTLHKAIGKHTIEHPEDWDALMDYCKGHGASCGNINKLYRASASWLQAFNELEYKRLYPAM
jgi:hypothetical protein